MVEIFYIDISEFTPRTYSELLSLLPKERRERTERYAFERDKYLSAAAGYALYAALKERGIDYPSAKIIFGDKGKPYIEGNRAYFSLSHSGNIALCAVSENEVGADIQKIKPLRKDIASRICTEGEAEIINSLSEENRTDFLFRIWAKKESVMKFYGLGFSLPLKDIDLSDGVKILGERADIFFKEYPLEGYKICACSPSDSFAREMKRVTIL